MGVIDRSSDERTVGRKNAHRSSTFMTGSFVIGESGTYPEAKLTHEQNIEAGRKVLAQIRARRIARGLPIDRTLG